MNRNSKIFVAGHNGMVGSSILNKLKDEGYTRIIIKTHSELDLTRQNDVENFFRIEKPDYVFLAAAKVGGILANSTNKADFYYINNLIACNVIHSAYKNKVKKLLNLGSSCIYPKLAPQPLKEEYLLTGELEPTNDAYAIAKISAIKMCQFYNEQYGTNFLSVMPTNLYGENDNFDLHSSHVLPSMIRKFHEAKINNTTVTLWGDGSPLREFLHVEDLADSVVFLMKKYNYEDIGIFVNIGTGVDLSIEALANQVAKTVGFEGDIKWDIAKPNGTPRKLLDVTRINDLGWKSKIELNDGISRTYKWFVKFYYDDYK